jgi:hypothetical protein
LLADSDELGDRRRGSGKVLQVVEDEEDAPVSQGMAQPLRQRHPAGVPHADRLGNRRDNQIRTLHRRERNEGNAVRERISQQRRHLQREARLAGASRPGERYQTHGLAGQKTAQVVDLLIPSDETPNRGRQPVCRLDRRAGWLGFRLLPGGGLERLTVLTRQPKRI